MNGVVVGCVTKENADMVMALQRLAVVIEADSTQPNWRREEARRLTAPNAKFNEERSGSAGAQG